MTDILTRLARLPEGRRAQLLAQLRAESDSATNARPGPRRGEGPAALSFNQEPLFSYFRLAPNEPTYSMPFCSRIRGPLDLDALRTALAAVVARHEALRTTIVERDGEPVQVIAAHVPGELPLVIVDGPTADERLAAMRSIVEAAALEPFDLGQSPLWRAAVYRIDEDDHVLQFNVHHIVFDGWSQGVFANDLAELYAAAIEHRPAQLAELLVQYPDFAVWQREWLSGARLDELSRWWRDTLSTAPVLEFPTDRPRPTRVSYAGAVGEYELPDGIPAAVDALARTAGVTPFIVYTAAFLALLQRYTGQDDLVIGSPNANRRHSELEPVIGFFINQLVLRTDVSGDPTFLELVARVRLVVQDAFAHGDIPFGKLVDAVRPPRDPSRQSLFQIAFALQEAGAPMQLAGTQVTEIELGTGTSRFDMAWNVIRDHDECHLLVEYSTTLFDAETMAGFARHFGQILRGVCAQPAAAISTVDIMAENEREELALWGSGPVRRSRSASIVDEFENQVAQAPDAVALVVAGVELSYAELNRQANQLAHHLKSAGVSPGQIVALALPRSVSLVVSMLAVLKAGGAYLPVDPGHPAARIAEIVDDANVRLVLTRTEIAARLGQSIAELAGPARLVALDAIAADLAGEPDTDPAHTAGPADIAYVIYTSGSTGKPKGVLIEHRNVVNFVESVRDLFGLTPADRLLGFASTSFDVSVFETFGALLTGARLYHTTDDERLDMARLQGLLDSAGITVVDLPPTVMALLEPERLPKLRIVFVGGEAFSADLVNRWNRVDGGTRRFFNGYGPTECTVTMIVHECHGTWDATPPIGLPMVNHVAHVLDSQLRLVPIGVAGELVIGGAGLTPGYLNAPELTSQKIIDDPFGTTPDGRLYRSGDLVKRRADGSLVFLGRIDQQVKIRGLRIELGEIEAALAAYPGIGGVAVQPWIDDAAEKHLVGYLTATGEAPEPPVLRDFLAQRLPTYMIPSFYVVLPELPLSASGKVNRRALPAPDLAALASGPITAPRTETERILVSEVIGPLLHRDEVGVHDDFFSLGGNSLQAAQLISSINRRFSVEVSLADFFLSPTPAHLGAVIDHYEQPGELTDDDLFTMIESMSEDEVGARLREESR
jgi:amino acid adenylation domain-containing protein